MSIARGGISWIAFSFLVTIVLIISTFFFQGNIRIALIFLSAIGALKTCILVVFFRDPERNIGHGIVAVADGVIREISKVKDKDVGECTKISTFMNIHNVHVNRMPIDGKIQDIIHIDGSHLPAFTKESERNERVVLLIKSKIGLVKVIQIAGTVARRIVPYIKKGDTVKKGEKIGLIRLGSRVDIYLPTKNIKQVTVKVKDRIKAGEDTIAEIHG